jgi:hypothetical protein
MRIESVSIIFATVIASGIAYAWWVTRARRRREPDLRRDGVLGKATVVGVDEVAGVVRVEYTFRHPFSGQSYSRVGTLPPGAAVPKVGDQVEIAYADEAPEVSRLRAEIEGS